MCESLEDRDLSVIRGRKTHIFLRFSFLLYDSSDYIWFKCFYLYQKPARYKERKVTLIYRKNGVVMLISHRYRY